MRRVAANIVYTNVKEFHKNHIVELFDGIVVNHYGLTEELAMTEWLGGIILLTKAEDLELDGIDSIEQFYERADNWDYQSKRFNAYHLNKVLSPSTKFSTDNGSSNCHIKRL